MSAVPPETSPGLLAQLGIPKNEAAWDRFVAEYRGYSMATCLRAGLQPHDAEEVTSRVIFSLYRAFPGFRYDPAKRFRGYLTRVIANAISGFRKECVRTPGSVGSGDDGQPMLQEPTIDPNDFAHELETRVRDGLLLLGRVLDAARRTVNHDTWLAFERTAIDGIDATTVAGELGKSVGAIYMAKSRTLQIIRREMARAKQEFV